ncbi:MAG: sulfatase-like hydrolase/transferase [Candidatus Latescibacteria bacterium]|nr:sulfatase-like hydrolase/transferase [Candidatus Latescibacterota bacterium]NIT02353.1 sulfatase-like hydrolase/transferase [Candidatus Latescibacterota bacterium]
MRIVLTALAFAAVGVLLLQVCLMQHGRDQGIYSVVGNVILEGGTPYKDAWDFKPPGIFFTYALAQGLFGPSMHSIRILEALALLSMIIAFSLLFRRLTGDWRIGIVAGIIALIYHLKIGFWETAQPESFAGTLIAWALVMATYVAPPESRSARLREHVAWAGCAVLFSLAAVLKPPLGGGIIFAYAVVIARQWRYSEPSRARRIASVTLSFFIGGALVVGLNLIYLVATGAWAEFRYIYFEYVPNYTGIHFAWGDLPNLLYRALSSFPASLHPFVWAGIVLALALPKRHPREKEMLFLVTGAAVIQVIGIALQAKFFPYHYGALLPLAALIAVWGYAKLWSLPKTRWAMLVVVILGAHYVSAQQSTIDRSRWRFAALFHPERSDEINDKLHTIHDVNARANRLAAEWIKENTPDNLPIYIWGFEPVIYHRSKRKPASKYIYNVPQRSAWGQEDAGNTLMKELTDSPPSVIITVKRDRFYHVVGNKKDSAEALRAFPQLSHFIHSGYVRIARIEDLTIYKRADLLGHDEQARLDQARRRQAREIPPENRHVLLLTVDTLRPDYLSALGYDLSTTPAIDELYNSATIFTHAVTPIPRTTQALASMLTGLYPHGTGVRTLVDQLSPDVISLSELARRRGYETVAVVSNHILPPERGLNRGFDKYDFAGDTRSAMETTEAVKAALGKNRSEDAIFLWVHYIDPHVPYFPKKATIEAFAPNYRGRYRYNFGDVYGGTGNDAYPKDLPKEEAVYQNRLPGHVNEHIRLLYAADVRDTDDAIAELLSYLRSNLGDDWSIVFTADHGESLGEHNFYYDHGDYVYNASSLIPMAIAFPPGHRYRAARMVDDWVSLIDIAPTLIDLLGWEVPDEITSQFEGRSLLPYLKGESLPPRSLFAECGRSYFPKLIKGRVRFGVAGRFRAVWKGDWKLIWTPFQRGDFAYQLYNMAHDPHEEKNLSGEYPDKVLELMREIEEWADQGEDLDSSPRLSEKEYKRLKSLGYVK